MEVEKKVDELPADDPPAQPEEAAVPLAFWGPLGKGFISGLAPWDMHFIALLCFNTCGKKRSKVHWPGSGVKCSQKSTFMKRLCIKKNIIGISTLSAQN